MRECNSVLKDDELCRSNSEGNRQLKILISVAKNKIVTTLKITNKNFQDNK